MTSMQEFSLHAQTWEYLVGIIGLLLFVPLWRAVNPRRKSSEPADAK
ncbi:MAG: hypothetical protein ACOZB3_03375 [Calditrichota bacterium]